jgi:hypothetical protein
MALNAKNHELPKYRYDFKSKQSQRRDRKTTLFSTIPTGAEVYDVLKY